VYDHDRRHDEGQNMHKVRGALEYYGVGQLDRACRTFGGDANGAGNRVRRPDQLAERQCHLLTDVCKLAEPHFGVVEGSERWMTRRS
jgi:hypothetical protein